MFEIARRATGGTDMSNLTIRPINTGFVTMIPKQYLYHHSTVAYYPDASDREEEYPVFTIIGFYFAIKQYSLSSDNFVWQKGYCQSKGF